MARQLSEQALQVFSNFLASKMGLYYSPDRYHDLQRSLRHICSELNHKNLEHCLDVILSSGFDGTVAKAIIKHLTISETYFFRDTALFETLSKSILPNLIAQRQGIAKYLRIISLACSTGEEPYSIAILINNLLPDISDWQVYIHAYDINPLFLQKAKEGIYSEWSFRGVPEAIKNSFFSKSSNGTYHLASKIRQMVTFSELNLADDLQRGKVLTSTTNADIIFCRNVLIYLTAEVKLKLADDLHKALSPEGILIVSPSEASADVFSKFKSVIENSTVYYKKSDPAGTVCNLFTEIPTYITLPESTHESPQELLIEDTSEITLPEDLYNLAHEAYQKHDYEQAFKHLTTYLKDHPKDSTAQLLLARIHASRGNLTEAEAICSEVLKHDKLNVHCLYLYGLIKQEQSLYQDAIDAMKKIIFLEPNFVLAHYNLACLCKLIGKVKEAQKHFANTLELVKSQPEDTQIPLSDGLTYKDLKGLIRHEIV